MTSLFTKKQLDRFTKKNKQNKEAKEDALGNYVWKNMYRKQFGISIFYTLFKGKI